MENEAVAYIKTFTTKQIVMFIIRQVVCFGTLVALLVYRKYVTVTMGSVGHFRYIESPLILTNGTSYLYSKGRMHTKYAELLFFPFHLSADWSYNQVALIYNL